MPSRGDFFNLYRHGFVRVAVATPRVRIGDPRHNADATLELMQQAARDKALLAVFPELGLSAYTCDDLFHQRTLIDAAENALAQLLARTRNLPLAALVGLPVAVDGRLYNRAARSRWPGRTPPSAPTCCSASPRCRLSSCTWRSARTSGCQRRPPRSRRSPAPASSAISPRRTSSSARRAIATSWLPTSRRAAWRPTCTARRESASPPPISPGTATRSSTRTAPCSPNRSASPPPRSSRSPMSIS